MKVTDLSENDEVVLTTPSGFPMKAKYNGFVPAAGRYEFLVDLAQDCSTMVLFTLASLNSYKIEPGDNYGS